jgi:hypothetical protein
MTNVLTTISHHYVITTIRRIWDEMCEFLDHLT